MPKVKAGYSAAVSIPAASVSSLVTTGIESAISYWAASCNIPPDVRRKAEAAGIKGRPLYGEAAFYDLPGWRLEFWHDGPNSEEGAGDVKSVLNRSAVQRAFALMGGKPELARHLNDIVQENEDADTSDVFLQLALMGDVIFG